MNFNYKKYFEEIRPKNELEIYNRFIFSFCSIHTSWGANVKGYELLKDTYHTDKKQLYKVINSSGLGLTNGRTKSIYEFTIKYLNKPGWYQKRWYESWQGYAKRLQNDIYGLGFAKTRFAIELLYPNDAHICCVDTHIIQWAKQNPNKVGKGLYHKIENGWINHSRNHGLKPVEARWRFWDNKQGYGNPRYWSHVLENKIGDVNEKISKSKL